MNSQRLAQLRISPLRVQQGLFAGLVLLLTLLAVQQWQLNDQANEAATLRQALISYNLSANQGHAAVSTAHAQASVRTLVPVDKVVSQESPVQLPQQQRWVF